MNPVETGKRIAKLRKEAGYTQASLAQALNITDKAVSKWERGCGFPDASLLPTLAKMLDCDIEILISGRADYTETKWTGLLVLPQGETSASTMVYDKPLINYLLSYFMLVGITKIAISADRSEYDYIRALQLEQFGLQISFFPQTKRNTMVVMDKVLLFGANLTRNFQSYMALEHTISPCIEDMDIPIFFAHDSCDLSVMKEKAEKKKMGRGLMRFPLTTKEEVRDASEFVRVYQSYHGRSIADLHEIAVNRGLIEDI